MILVLVTNLKAGLNISSLVSCAGALAPPIPFSNLFHLTCLSEASRRKENLTKHVALEPFYDNKLGEKRVRKSCFEGHLNFMKTSIKILCIFICIIHHKKARVAIFCVQLTNNVLVSGTHTLSLCYTVQVKQELLKCSA